MTGHRAACLTTTLWTLLASAVGCTSAGEESGSSATVPSQTAPTLAGTAEAAAVSRLPSGTATGTAVLAYSGIGELNEPFLGDCVQTGATTEISGAADTAQISLRFTPDATALTMEDIGLDASGDLATGRYEVDGTHLSLDAPLVQDGQVIGSVQLEVDCGS